MAAYLFIGFAPVNSKWFDHTKLTALDVFVCVCVFTHLCVLDAGSGTRLGMHSISTRNTTRAPHNRDFSLNYTQISCSNQSLQCCCSSQLWPTPMMANRKPLATKRESTTLFILAYLTPD